MTDNKAPISAFDFIKMIESDHPVSNIRFKDASLWPLIRGQLFNAYNSISLGKSYDRAQLTKKTNAFKFFSTCFYGLRNLPKLFSAKYFIFSASERRKKFQDFWIDRVAEGLMDKMAHDYVFIENPAPLWKHFPRHKLKHKQVLSDSSILLFAFLLGYFLLPLQKITGLDILCDIQKKYKISFPWKTYLRRYLGQYYLYRFFTVFHSPKIAFFVYPGSWFGVIHALKTRKTKIVELQHGRIYKNHLAYCYFKQNDGLLLPDFLFTYGSSEKNILTGNHFLPAEKIVPVGYYFLSLFCEQTQPKLKLESFKVVATFSHQIANENLGLDFLENVARLNKDVLFIICPRAPTGQLEALQNKRQENILIDYSRNIYELLVASDIHLCVSSSTTLDALGLGKPSILFDIQGSATKLFGKDFSPFVKLLDTPEQFKVCLNELLDFLKKNTIDTSYFFKTHFSKNIEKFLKEHSSNSDGASHSSKKSEEMGVPF